VAPRLLLTKFRHCCVALEFVQIAFLFCRLILCFRFFIVVLTEFFVSIECSRFSNFRFVVRMLTQVIPLIELSDFLFL
jgi:hypothetical protein